MQLEALICLYRQGLRGDHLRGWSTEYGDVVVFTYYHAVRLINLMTVQNYSAQEAIRLLSVDENIRLDKQATEHHFVNKINENEKQLQQLASTSALKSLGYCMPEIPDEMKCPISLQLMDEPVLINGFSHAFEQRYLLAWFAISLTNPLTKSPVELCQIIPAIDLKRAITLFLHETIEKKQFYERCLEQRNTPEKCLHEHYKFTLFFRLKDDTRLDPEKNPKAIVPYNPSR